MSNGRFTDMTRNRLRTGFEEVHRRWGWYLALGVFLLVLGFAATGMAVTTTMLSIMMLGWILVIAGAGLIVSSFLTGRWGGFLLTLAAGVLSGIAGITILSYPVSGAVAITLMVGAILVAAGLFRLVASILMQFPNWGWSFASGLTTFALGIILLSGWQTTSLWFFGFYLGIDLICHGLSWIMFALTVHRLAGKLEVTDADRRAA